MPLKSERGKAPVFVVGSPRSGTTLLYDVLLSAGGFAVYLTESNAFSVLARRFGDLHSESNRRQLLQVWLGSKLFRASGLDAATLENKVMQECRSHGDFLRITMEEIARAQGMVRWAENTPEHLLYIPSIKAALPDALFVHMVRDGRAVALSSDRRADRGIAAMPWDRKHNLLVQGAYWEWIVRRGRAHGKALGGDYMELRFEDLIQDTDTLLARLGEFIGQELNYERIQRVAYGSVSKPNTSFKKETKEDSFDPVSRWQKSYTPEQLEAFEGMVGACLQELGYPLSSSGTGNARLRAMRSRCQAYFSFRFALKSSVLAHFLRPALSAQDLDEIVMGEDRPPVLKAP